MKIKLMVTYFLTALLTFSMVGCGNSSTNTSTSSSEKKVADERDVNIVNSKERSTQDYYEKKVKCVVLGDAHSAAITDDDCLYLWGANYRGQLGDGSEFERNTPVKIMNNVECVSLGYNHSAAITKDGGLYLWGCNYYGQLGDGTVDQRDTPVRIMDNVKSVSLGYEHSAAITNDGSLYVWGRNCAVISDDADLDDDSDAIVDTALDDDVDSNDNDDSDEENDTEVCNTPIKIMDNVKSVSLGSNLNASSEADNHSAALTESGELFMWGCNSSGQLGDGTHESKFLPIKVMDNVKSVSLGYNHSAAITEDGKLYLWGDNYLGQIGDKSRNNRYEPVEVMSDIREVSLGWRHSAAITNDGDLYLWGDNYYGQLGNFRSGGDITSMDEDIESKEPVKVLSNVNTVSLGSEHSAAVKEDGSLYLWGSNKHGQIGVENDSWFKHGYNEYGGIGNNETVYIDYPIQIIPDLEYINSHSNKTETDNSALLNDSSYQDSNGSSTLDVELEPDVHYFGTETIDGVTLNYDLYMLPNKSISITTPTETGGSISFYIENLTFANGVYSYTNGVESEMVPGAMRSLVAASDLSGEIRIIDSATIEWTNIANTVGRNFSVVLRK